MIYKIWRMCWINDYDLFFSWFEDILLLLRLENESCSLTWKMGKNLFGGFSSLFFSWKKYEMSFKRTNYAIMTAHEPLITACMRMRPYLSLVDASPFFLLLKKMPIWLKFLGLIAKKLQITLIVTQIAQKQIFRVTIPDTNIPNLDNHFIGKISHVDCWSIYEKLWKHWPMRESIG